MAYEETDKIFDETQKRLDSIRTDLYSFFKRPSHSLPQIDIMDMPVHMIPPPILHTPPKPSPFVRSPQKLQKTPPKTSPRPNAPSAESRDPERRSHRNVAKPASYAEPEIPDPGEDIELVDVAGDASTARPVEEDVQIVSQTQISWHLMMPKGPLVRAKPKIAELYYAIKQAPFGAWGKVRIFDIISREEVRLRRPASVR